jgi:hypothetical protein
MTPEELLLKAADDMAEHGHCKGSFFEDLAEWETTPSCAYGSLARVAGVVQPNGLIIDCRDLDPEAVKRLAAVIRPLHPHPFVDYCDDYDVITTYNDHDSVTGEDMILAFKKAAAGDV